MNKSIMLKSVVYSVDTHDILRGVSLTVSEGECFCLFGENGAGKSTLFKLIVGDLKPDEGAVHHSGHLRFVYVAQEFVSVPDETVEGYVIRVAGAQFIKKVADLSTRLGYSTLRHKASLCNMLSGGQQKILALSVAVSQRPDFLLLDEPENHLDIVSRQELVSILSDFGGGLLLVSHDRFVIDSLSSKVGELAGGHLHIVEGGYQDYIDDKMRRLGGMQRAYDAETKRIVQLRSSLVILKQKAIRGNDVAQYKKRLAEFEELRKSHKESARPDVEQNKINLKAAGTQVYKGKLVMTIKDAAFGYKKGKPIFDNTHLDMYAGQKVVLLGRNGVGKSTFLRCLKNELELSKGDITLKQAARIAFFDQHATFDGEQTALQIVADRLHVGETDAKAALGAMKFDATRMETKSSNLSGGERMRVRFALAFGQKPDVLVLDEPTNHIDEVTWEILLSVCKAYTGALLVVTHDHEFIDELKPDLYWMFKDGSVVARHKHLEDLIEELRQA